MRLSTVESPKIDLVSRLHGAKASAVECFYLKDHAAKLEIKSPDVVQHELDTQNNAKQPPGKSGRYTSPIYCRSPRATVAELVSTNARS